MENKSNRNDFEAKLIQLIQTVCTEYAEKKTITPEDLRCFVNFCEFINLTTYTYGHHNESSPIQKDPIILGFTYGPKHAEFLGLCKLKATQNKMLLVKQPINTLPFQFRSLVERHELQPASMKRQLTTLTDEGDKREKDKTDKNISIHQIISETSGISLNDKRKSIQDSHSK